MELSFFIRSRPVAKQSFKMGKFGGYKPKAVANWEAEVRLRASQAAANQGPSALVGVLIRVRALPPLTT